jgi:very-short-patch-repair endonuclease
MNICKCGCGELVEKNYKRGHARRGKTNTIAHNAAIARASKSKVKSAASIQKCLQTKLERYGNFNHTAETKAKISNTAKERGVGKWMLGRVSSAETKAKIGKSLQGHYTSEETRNKIGDKNRGEKNGMYGRSQKDFMSEEKYDQYLLSLSKGKKKWWKNYPQDKKNNWIERLKEQRKYQVLPVTDTKIEIKIKQFLDRLSIKYIQHKLIQDIDHSYQCDFFLKDFNMVIECDGDYWHNYPDYRDIDILRTKELKDKKYRVLRLWERDIKNLDIDEFKYHLISNLNDDKYIDKL